MNNKNELDLFVAEVLSGTDSHRILSFITGKMRQFHLSSQYHAHEIFAEAYLRTSRRIEAGTLISNLLASFKVTVLYIVREYSNRRNAQRNLVKKSKIKTDTVEEISVPDCAVEPNLVRLRTALKTMKPQELLILRLRIVESLSWSEIENYLVGCKVAEGNTPKFRSTLRQRGKRGLERLRQNYFSAQI